MRALAPSSDEDDDDGDVAVVDPDGAAFASMSDESINASLAPSIYALTRALKRASLGVFHCVHSVAMDTTFVAEQRRRFSSVPMFANLRAGAWYVDEDVRECYFKSTDGHFGNWQFSATRLNAHVAREAARAGGCVIVDATRSSVKRFPDALAKTIPIWADTWNRAREAALTKRDGRETDWLRTSSAANGPHLPDWISANEQNSIRAKIGEYASAFNALDVDALEATESLAKPFRCVWISQAECGLEFELKDAERDGYTPIILVTASAPLHWRGERRASANGTSFAYIPGAGDDEESWAGGLTPAMFRTHKDALLDACERDIGSTIARIVEGRVDAPRKLDPRARFAAKGCEVDAEVAERISQQSGYIREGDPYTIAEEAGTMLTGLRPMKLNIGRSLQYAGGEYSSLRSSAVQIFTKVADDNDATEEDILNAYRQANEARRRQQAKLKARIDAAMDAGMSRGEIYKALTNTGVSRREIGLIMANKYLPIRPSRDVIREVVTEARDQNRILQRLPVQEIYKIYRDINTTPIVGEREPEFQLPTALGPADSDFVLPEPIAPVQDPVQVAPAPQAQPQAAPATQLPFLGGNPIDALKNLEILQRLRGGQ